MDFSPSCPSEIPARTLCKSGREEMGIRAFQHSLLLVVTTRLCLSLFTLWPLGSPNHLSIVVVSVHQALLGAFSMAKYSFGLFLVSVVTAAETGTVSQCGESSVIIMTGGRELKRGAWLAR